MKDQPTELDWQKEEANRVNQMSKTAERKQVVVDVKAKTPKLNPDGSLKGDEHYQ